MRLPASPRCVITGAGSGFGRAFALELAGRGARLVLSDIDLPGCEETARLATAAGALSALAVRCDVTRVCEVEELAAACDGGLDLVVNNAGVASAGRVGELSLEDWRWTLDVDLWGVVHCCHVFVPLLRRQGHGHLLNVASAAGLVSPPRTPAYNVAKAGVVSLSETLAAELQGTKVGVTVLCPTYFQTNIAAKGRFADGATRNAAKRLIAAGMSSHEVARAALAAVERGELYSVPMADGRWSWWFKRVAPSALPGLLARWGQWALR